MKLYSIAIDGPAGSGKSSVAKELAKQLNFDYVNSGSFYRAIAFYLNQKGIDYVNAQLTYEWLDKNINLTWDGENILLNDEPVTEIIDDKRFSHIASVIATIPTVRQFVNKNIAELANLRSVVVDGRDIGTVVLPKATVKIFLDADVRTRAGRRLKQYQNKGKSVLLDEVINEIIERDNRDYTREVGPLVKAADATILDNSNMTFAETIEAVKKIYMGKVIDEEWIK